MREAPPQLSLAGYEFSREKACILIELDELSQREAGPIIARNVEWYVRRRLAQACPWSVWFEQLWALEKFRRVYGAALGELMNAGLLKRASRDGYYAYEVTMQGSDVAAGLRSLLPARMDRDSFSTYTDVCHAVRQGRTSRSIGCVRSVELRKESAKKEQAST